ncbi:MAG: hypothetical protein A2W01_08055 [Candidatus Solincola sediminis]|uniref:Uncharacterized protein n=1 Tax=Candidatus Solincola sediminis TaxID=1797199 RepID=A0A1F2WS92_9ACTN|nr:MAG: hypothetical protein A2Y75_04900 [Candidatus Solincola sediminis]OFW61613.1 MAG: hypothetical protein A2W01_08055 [Candidatus Solincola sediminis]
MNDHEDRGPLVIKMTLRQASQRLRQEVEAVSQMEALAANLGWDRVAECAGAAKQALRGALTGIEHAVQAAAEVQEEAKRNHVQGHQQGHRHSH